VEGLLVDTGAADESDALGVRQERQRQPQRTLHSYRIVTTVTPGGDSSPRRIRSSTAQAITGVPGQSASRARRATWSGSLLAVTISSNRWPRYFEPNNSRRRRSSSSGEENRATTSTCSVSMLTRYDHAVRIGFRTPVAISDAAGNPGAFVGLAARERGRPGLPGGVHLAPAVRASAAEEKSLSSIAKPAVASLPWPAPHPRPGSGIGTPRGITRVLEVSRPVTGGDHWTLVQADGPWPPRQADGWMAEHGEAARAWPPAIRPSIMRRGP
jgi:hypothetical protein